MTTSSTLTTDITRQSERYIAGGVVSLNRKATPNLIFTRADGARLYDADGKCYLDYHAAFAPHLLGHNHPQINAAVQSALAAGWSLMGSGTTSWEAELAERVCSAVPNLERIQLLNSGSEASNLAIRLARAHTCKEDVVTTLGGYNGWHDEVGRAVMPSLADLGPRVSPGEYPLIPISAGIPATTRRRIHVVNFNDLDSVEYVFRRHPVACLVTEPVLQNIGVVLPEAGYLSGLRELCNRYGVVFILDEVKTGFRSALGGYQSLCGVQPDLTILGKAVASGYPLSVLGGRKTLMDLFSHPDPRLRVLVAGTYNGHPIAAAAAIATLKILEESNGAIYRSIATQAARLEEGLLDALRSSGRSVTTVRNASALCFYFMDHAPRDWHDILQHHDFDADRRLRADLVANGIYIFPLPCKQISVSAAHTAEDIDRTLEAIRKAAARLG